MMKINFYLLASSPAISNKESIICQIILPDKATLLNHHFLKTWDAS